MRTVRGRRPLMVFIAVAGFLAGCSNDAGLPEVSAVVEGTDIPTADTEELVDAYLARESDAPERPARLLVARLVLGYQIQLTLLEHLAEARGIKSRSSARFDDAVSAVDPTTFEAVGMRSEDFVRTLRAAELGEAIAEDEFPDVDISESQVATEYEKRKRTFSRSYQAKVTIAQFSAEAQAGAVQGKVAAGETFKEAAMSLGALQIDELDVNPFVDEVPADLLDAIEAAEVGSVTPAVEVASGWLSVLVSARDEQPEPTLEDLRDELTDLLAKVERLTLFDEWFDKQFQQADIKVDGYYGDWDADTQTVL